MAAALPYVLAIGSAMLQNRSIREAEKKQKRVIDEGERIAAEKAAQARAKALENAQRYAPETRQQRQADIEQSLESEFQRALAESSPLPQSTLGATSGAYQGALQSAADAAGARANRLNKLTSKTLAPGRLGVEEGIGTASAAEQAGSLYGSGDAAVRAARIDASRITPSPLGNILGGVLQGAAGNDEIRKKARAIFPYGTNQR